MQDILRRLADLAREIEPYVNAHSEESVYIDYRQGSWSPAMLAQFQREIHPYPAAVGLLRFAAQHAGVEVTYRDFLAQSQWNDVKVRTELGAISKVARKLFGKKVWPVRTRQGSDGVMRYFMPEGIAEWWTRGDPAAEADS